MNNSDINPELVQLYKNAVTACWGKCAPDSELHEPMRNLAQGLCSTISSSLTKIDSFFVLADQNDFTGRTWDGVLARFKPVPKDAARMRNLLFTQFQRWAADPTFKIPNGALHLDDDGVLIVQRTGNEPPPRSPLAPITRAQVFPLGQT